MLHASAVDPTMTILPLPPVRIVAAMTDADRATGNVHDHASRAALLDRIAALLDVPVGAPVDDATLHVPGDAIETAEAMAAGIRRADRILGGVVPAAFVATKAITHGLLHPDAQCPPLWSPAMVELMGDAALAGYAAFNREDALAAGRRLLARGPVRIKDVCAKAGLGQIVVHDDAALAYALSREDDATLARHGIVLEENLTDVVTYSVGVIELGGRTISYWGSQNLTRDHLGRDVYGGSDLYVVRGGVDALAAEPLPPAIARAVACAGTFDCAARLAYPDLLLTRRNYDVIEGTDATGERRIGVLEQSWRVGGASGAEIAAFEALRDEPDTHAVRCSTVEVYAEIDPPTGATLYYRGVDPKVGAMTKYAVRLA
ncbi:DUF3182 family protein [Sphingomonas sp. Leaf10]|uniref:DUF3182 family protein n=1 Tax=Sphingomonas sp. Leaf10 TaxID=1735676 RepID=UPI0006FBD7CA|nr:DUF3182 family protein [Sphingomonas sp. Leaf10]KQM30903.1 hypothetical protein ASE59_07370 [Sphingomonas sp. Leaf10]